MCVMPSHLYIHNYFLPQDPQCYLHEFLANPRKTAPLSFHGPIQYISQSLQQYYIGSKMPIVNIMVDEVIIFSTVIVVHIVGTIAIVTFITVFTLIITSLEAIPILFAIASLGLIVSISCVLRSIICTRQ